MSNLQVKTSDQQDLFNNKYDYDKVGNVTYIENIAGITSNNMGGTYDHSFVYDKLNRLSYAKGNFNGNETQQEIGNDFQSNYDLTMNYNNTHGIDNKEQYHNKNNQIVTPNTYNNAYKYMQGTHQLQNVVDANTGNVEGFEYDLNGNLKAKSDPENTRILFWDESSRLRVVNDQNAMQHYIYDASGERVLKANSDYEAVYENGMLENANINFNGYTTYPSAFIVIDPQGIYSKHYYAGSQRIVSRIGEQPVEIFDASLQKSTSDNKTDYKKIQQLQLTDLRQIAEKAKLGTINFKDYQPHAYDELQKMMAEGEDAGENVANRAPEFPPIYFYHPDHLGTSTFLTDANGNAYQFFLNLPFGETMAEQLPSSYYQTPYKFNGKELDAETGLYYYGARYYDPRISIWYSVDPLAEMQPNKTPYHYCSNNPVSRTDPTGMLDGDYYDKEGTYLGNDGIDDNKVYQLKDKYDANFKNKNVNWGGELSEKHSSDLKSKSNDLGIIQEAFVTGDAVSDKRIQSLHPAIRMQATDFIKEANVNSSGTLIRVAQGFRTYAEQDALYAQGRTASGSIVTKAKGGFSNHNFGLAFDIVGITNGIMDYNLDWKSLSILGKSKGLEWGGDWKFKDMPHFENMFGNSLKELRGLPKNKNGLPILKP